MKFCPEFWPGTNSLQSCQPRRLFCALCLTKWIHWRLLGAKGSPKGSKSGLKINANSSKLHSGPGYCDQGPQGVPWGIKGPKMIQLEFKNVGLFDQSLEYVKPMFEKGYRRNQHAFVSCTGITPWHGGRQAGSALCAFRYHIHAASKTISIY